MKIRIEIEIDPKPAEPRPRKRSLAEVLLEIPTVDTDDDLFERVDEKASRPDPFS